MLETYVLALRNGVDGNFNLGLSQNVGGGGHIDEEVWISQVSLCQISGPIFPIRYLYPSSKQQGKPTLNSSLGTDSRSQTEGTGHEVGENLVRARALAGGVFAEVGDLQGRGVLLGATERAVKGGGFGVRDSPPLLVGGGNGAGGGGQLLPGASAQERGGSGGERHDEKQLSQLREEGEVNEGRIEVSEDEVGGGRKTRAFVSWNDPIGITGLLIG